MERIWILTFDCQPKLYSNRTGGNFFMPKGTEISDTTMSIVLHSDLIIKNGILAETLVLEGNWRYSQEAMMKYAKKKELYILNSRKIIHMT